MMSIFVWTVFMLSCILVTAQTDNSQLIFLQMIFRHGARSPVKLYPGDPNPAEIWKEGFGQLTQLGRKQHYVLGKYLRSRYSGFVTSNPREVLVNSTQYDRCLMSALANLASFYAPTSQWAFDDRIDWHPIPVHSSPIAQDKYLSSESECLRSSEDQDRRFSSEEFFHLIAKYKPLLKVVKLHCSFEHWTKALLLQDTLEIEKAHGLPVPSWVEPYWDQLTELSGVLFNYSFSSELQQRLRGGPLLGKIIKNMDEKIAGKIPHLRVQMFSSHDTILVALLQALRVYNNKRPPFCATLLFELYQKPSGLKEVRLLYLNSTRPDDVTSHVPHVLQLEGCSEYCPLDTFRAITRHLIPDDYDLECRPVDPDYKQPDNAFVKQFSQGLFENEANPVTTSFAESGFI